MSWKATAYVKGLSLAPNGETLTRSEKLLLLMLAEAHTDNEATSFFSLELLASMACLSDERLHRLLARLQKKGVIARHDGLRNGVRTTSRSIYYNFPELSGKEPV